MFHTRMCTSNPPKYEIMRIVSAALSRVLRTCVTRMSCVTCVTDNPHDVGFWRIRWNPYLTAFTAHEQLKGQVSLPSANRAPRPTPFRKKNFTPRCESFLYPLSFWLLLRWVACDCSVVLRLLGHL